MFALALTTLQLDARAQTNAETKASARSHFQAGLSAAEQSDLTLALREFEAAYAAQPHFSVLYNIGRAEAGLGKHVEAVEIFERYLAEGATQITATREAEVRSLLATSRRQIGKLDLIVAEPNRTRVWLDGVELTPSEPARVVPLPVGVHNLIYSSRASAPVAESFEIAPSATTEIRLATAPTAPDIGRLEVYCDVPAVEVTLDGRLIGLTPLAAAIPVIEGQHRVRFFRLGYPPTERRVMVTVDATASIACARHPESRLSRSVAAHLELSLEPADAESFVDGERLRGGALPSGPHLLTITRDGFLPLTKSISLVPGRTTRYSISLRRTPRAEARRRAALNQRHGWAYVLGGAGLAFLAASTTVYLWNGQRYDRWQASAQHDLGRALSIQRFDDLALGLLLGGVGLGAGGAWLTLASPPNMP